MGSGFSYVGRQMELQMPGGQTFFPDLVFYHIPQHRYVVVELKAVKFIPEFAGKLNFYVTAAAKSRLWPMFFLLISHKNVIFAVALVPQAGVRS